LDWSWRELPHVNDNCLGPSSSGFDVDEGEHFMVMTKMVFDTLKQYTTFQSLELNNMEEPPNEEDQRFYNLFLKTNKPLFKCVRLLACKSNWNILWSVFGFYYKNVFGCTTMKENLPKNYYYAKRLMSKLGFEAKRINWCMKGCMLFYDNEYGRNDGALLQCKFYSKLRYHTMKVGRNKNKLLVLSQE